jgi:hypothetical protein
MRNIRHDHTGHGGGAIDRWVAGAVRHCPVALVVAWSAMARRKIAPMAVFNAVCALGCNTRMATAAEVTAADDRWRSKYFIEPLIAVLCARVIGMIPSVLDPTARVGRSDAE